VAAGATIASGNNPFSFVSSLTAASDNSGGGTVAPGQTLGGLNSIGLLTVNGALTLGSGSFGSTTGKAHLSMELGGTSAGADYDQISTTGAVSLLNADASIHLINAYTPQLGDTLILILNGSNSAVTGSFANINGFTATEGSLVFVDSQPFTVTYAYNGDGFANDVALVSVPEPGTYALLALSALSLAAWRRRR
jgi:hypothetical protein